MNISYFGPLSRAWNHMKLMLFKPFNIGKWFALGFTAFLADLLDFGNEGSSSFEDKRDINLDNLFHFPDEIRDWIEMNPDWFALIVTGIIVIVLLIILLTWLSSRGKFMFLDNVVYNRALIKKPWNDFKIVGNSLFFWRLGYGFFVIVLLGGFLSYAFLELREMYIDYASDGELIASGIKMGLFFIVLMIATGYISLFMEDFVVPLMYKNNCRIWIGWSQFMPLFTGNFFNFVLYGLFIFVLYMLVFALIVALGFLTCCVGFLILIIPYISSVVLLPVSVTFRSLSVAFIEQFGAQYKIFPELPADTENPE